MSCPKPELDGMSVQDKELGPNVFGIGQVRWQAEHSRWQCLANVSGALCLIEVKVRDQQEVSQV